jgi:hypothetical protein
MGIIDSREEGIYYAIHSVSSLLGKLFKTYESERSGAT